MLYGISSRKIETRPASDASPGRRPRQGRVPATILSKRVCRTRRGRRSSSWGIRAWAKRPSPMRLLVVTLHPYRQSTGWPESRGHPIYCGDLPAASNTCSQVLGRCPPRLGEYQHPTVARTHSDGLGCKESVAFCSLSTRSWPDAYDQTRLSIHSVCVSILRPDGRGRQRARRFEVEGLASF
jgi:hypothetical protein